jgi:hypothetical protein
MTEIRVCGRLTDLERSVAPPRRGLSSLVVLSAIEVRIFAHATQVAHLLPRGAWVVAANQRVRQARAKDARCEVGVGTDDAS